jgi:hypothetical protein
MIAYVTWCICSRDLSRWATSFTNRSTSLKYYKIFIELMIPGYILTGLNDKITETGKHITIGAFHVADILSGYYLSMALSIINKHNVKSSAWNFHNYSVKSLPHAYEYIFARSQFSLKNVFNLIKGTKIYPLI